MKNSRGFRIKQMKECHNYFKNGRTLVDRDSHSGRPLTSWDINKGINQVRVGPSCYRLRNYRCDEVWLITGSLYSILSMDLTLPRVFMKFMKKLLKAEPKHYKTKTYLDVFCWLHDVLHHKRLDLWAAVSLQCNM